MVSKLGIPKKSKHIELKYLHLQGLVESRSRVITVHKIGTQSNPSDVLTNFMPQSVLSKHFSKIGVAKTGIDEVSIQHLKEKLKTNAISNSTAEIDVRTPKSRKMGDDSVGVSSQDTPERSEIQTRCICEATVGLRQCQVGECRHMSCMRHRYWVARDQVSSQRCCQCCFPTTVKCYQLDGKVRCKSCAHQNHRGPLIRIRDRSSVSLTTSSSEPDQSEAEEEERVIEEEIKSQGFIGMINFTGRDVDSFHLVDQDSSKSLSLEERKVQGRDLSQAEVTRVQVRAHQWTLQDGRVVNVGVIQGVRVKEGHLLTRESQPSQRWIQEQMCDQIGNQSVMCSQNHFGSMNSGQSQDGQCSQCLDHLGSRSSAVRTQTRGELAGCPFPLMGMPA
eukprot:6485681-Amphidinium_carterae.1